MSGTKSGMPGDFRAIAKGMLKAAIKEGNQDAVDGYLRGLRNQGLPAEEIYQEALEEMHRRRKRTRAS